MPKRYPVGWRIAAHEAGHAVIIALLCSDPCVVQSLSINLAEGTGLTQFNKAVWSDRAPAKLQDILVNWFDAELDFAREMQELAEVVMLAAGHAAEALYFKSAMKSWPKRKPTGAISRDYERAREKVAALTPEQVNASLVFAWETARAIAQIEQAKIELVAKKLMQLQRLDQAEFMRAIVAAQAPAIQLSLF